MLRILPNFFGQFLSFFQAVFCPFLKRGINMRSKNDHCRGGLRRPRARGSHQSGALADHVQQLLVHTALLRQRKRHGRCDEPAESSHERQRLSSYRQNAVRARSTVPKNCEESQRMGRHRRSTVRSPETFSTGIFSPNKLNFSTRKKPMNKQ